MGWDHVPTVPYVELIRAPKTVSAICGLPMLSGSFEGCTRSSVPALLALPALDQEARDAIATESVEPGLCVIFLAETFEFKSQSPHLHGLERHEFAHCNGLLHSPTTGHGWYKADGTEVSNSRMAS